MKLNDVQSDSTDDGLGLSMDDYLGYLNRTEESEKAGYLEVLRLCSHYLDPQKQSLALKTLSNR